MVFDRLTDLLGVDDGGEEVSEYWQIQRLTYKGGWRTWGADRHDQPPDRPDPDDLDPGRYRAIRRREGRIDGVEWAVETEDAQALYEERRQRDKLDEWEEAGEPDEIEAAREAGDLDRLDDREIAVAELRASSRKIEQEEGADQEDEGLDDLGRELIEAVREEQGSLAALEAFIDLRAAEEGMTREEVEERVKINEWD